MRITGEITSNPGAITLFLIEIRLEKSELVSKGWWGLWFAWWAYKPSHWREWLWHWDTSSEFDNWSIWQVRLLGFEINWQRRL